MKKKKYKLYFVKIFIFKKVENRDRDSVIYLGFGFLKGKIVVLPK